jgi:hypothetical protein
MYRRLGGTKGHCKSRGLYIYFSALEKELAEDRDR